MKKQYMKPNMVVVELKHKAALLIGSTDTMLFMDDPELIIDDPIDIH